MNYLTAKFPALEDLLPFVSLTRLPTRVEPAHKLGARIGLDSLTIKRDDESADFYGGNKTRKLEYVLADARARGCDAVVTFGSAGSNHALATAIYAQRLGLQCYAVLTHQAHTPYVAATLRYHVMLGTKLVHAGRYQDVVATYEKVVESHPSGADRVYKITWGGSSWLGTTGFVAAALELAEQLPASQIPELIYVACGTMGTAVGLALGLRLAGLPTRVLAIKVAPGPRPVDEEFERLFETTDRELRQRDPSLPALDEPLANVELREEFLGPGYAIPTPECSEAIELIYSTEGLKLEATYTGKALGALVQDARRGRLAGRRVMFWNTYNSRPYPEGIDAIGAEALPDAFRHYLAE
jgi:D-cysteine desulfhydrase